MSAEVRKLHPDVLQQLQESKKAISNFYFVLRRCSNDSICNNPSFEAPPLGQRFLFLFWLLGQRFLQESPATSSRRFQSLQGQDGNLIPTAHPGGLLRAGPSPNTSRGSSPETSGRPPRSPPLRGGSTPSSWRMSDVSKEAQFSRLCS